MTQILRPTVEVTNDGHYYDPNHLTSAFVSPQGAGFPYVVDQGFAYKAVSATADINGLATKTVTFSGFGVKTDSWADGNITLQMSYNATGTIISNCTAPKVKVEVSKDAGATWSNEFEVRWDVSGGDAGNGLTWLQPAEYLSANTTWKLNSYPNNPQINSALNILVPALSDTTKLQIRLTVAGGYIIPQGWPDSSPNAPFYIGAGFQIADVFVTDPTFTAPPPGGGTSVSDVTVVIKSGDTGGIPNTRDPKVEFYLTNPPSGQAAGWFDSYISQAPAEWATIPGTSWVDYNGLTTQAENTTIKARCQFELPTGFSNARLSLALMADNVVTDITLNGTSIGSQTDNGNDANTRHWTTPTTFTHSANFVEGVNTIEFTLKNYLNRSALDFLGQIVYTPASVGTGTGPVVTPTYEIPIISVGGKAPYTYSILNDSQTTLPLSACQIVAPSTLRVTGSGVAAGIYTIHLGVTDADGESDSQIVAVNVLDHTKFNIINQSFAETPSSLPYSGSKSLLYFGGAGNVTWELIPGVTTLETALIQGSTLLYTLNQYGNYRIGLKATDALGKIATKLINLVVTADSAYKLVDGQLELQYTDENTILPGSHNFSFVIADKNSQSAQRSFNYVLNPTLSPIASKQYAVNKYWSMIDSAPYTMPIKGTIGGVSLGNSAPVTLSNGLSVAVNGASKSVVFSGNVSTPVNAIAKVTVPLLRGSDLVGEIVRAYAVVPYAGSTLGDLGNNTVVLQPFSVGQFFTLNPQKPYYNSPDNSRNITWKARVQAGSKLPTGISLDKNTGLLYGPVVTSTNETSVVEFVDEQGTVRGAFSIKFDFVKSDLTFTQSLPIGRTHAAYSGSFIASGSNVVLNTAQLYAGFLPEGLILGVSGNTVTLTGIPVEAGYFDFWLKVTATDGSVGYIQKRVEVEFVEPLKIVTTSLPPVQTSRAYNRKLQVIGGSGVYTWSLGTGGTLPSSITLSADGVISGTTADATYSQSVKFVVTDSYGATTFVVIPMVIDNSLTIITTSPLPSPTVGVPYNLLLEAEGGSGLGYTWALDPTSPALPSGIVLNPNGTLSGTTSISTYNQDLVVSLTDSTTVSVTKALNLRTKVVAPTFSFSTAGVGPIKRGVAYTGILAITGTGTAPYRWTANTSVLPPGLVLTANPSDQGATAILSGITTEILQHEVVNVSVTDASGATVNGVMSLSSIPAVSIKTVSLPQGKTSAPYSNLLTGEGNAPLVWSLESGSLPAGYTFGSNGRISGTTMSPFTGDITVKLTDALGDFVTKTFSLSVLASTLAVSTTSIPSIPRGQAWEYQLQGTGGVPFTDPTYPYGWKVEAPQAGSGGASGWRVEIEAVGTISDSIGGSVGDTGAAGTYTVTAVNGSGTYTGTGTFSWEVDFPTPPSWSTVVNNYGPVIQVSVTDAVTGQVISGSFQIPVLISRDTVYPSPVSYSTVLTTTSTTDKVLPAGISLDMRSGILSGVTNDTYDQDIKVIIWDSVGAVESKILRLKTVAPVASGELKSAVDQVWGTNTKYLGAIGMYPAQVASITPRPNGTFIVTGTMPGATADQLSVSVVTNNGTGAYTNLKGRVDSVSNGSVKIGLFFADPDLPGQAIVLTNPPDAPQGNTVAVTLTNNTTGAVHTGVFNFRTVDTGVLTVKTGNGSSLPTAQISTNND